jgi:NAD(P)-dependent dehydrogenase (short-subunit alcohol dehydrogenase family)
MSGVLVVTGASRGIGAACARRAAQAGWKVADLILLLQHGDALMCKNRCVTGSN